MSTSGSAWLPGQVAGQETKQKSTHNCSRANVNTCREASSRPSPALNRSLKELFEELPSQRTTHRPFGLMASTCKLGSSCSYLKLQETNGLLWELLGCSEATTGALWLGNGGGSAVGTLLRAVVRTEGKWCES